MGQCLLHIVTQNTNGNIFKFLRKNIMSLQIFKKCLCHEINVRFNYDEESSGVH